MGEKAWGAKLKNCHHAMHVENRRQPQKGVIIQSIVDIARLSEQPQRCVFIGEVSGS